MERRATKDFTINKKEALRYLGYKNNAPDDTTKALLGTCEAALFDAIQPKCIFEKTPVKISGNTIDFGYMQVNSHALAKNLEDCKSAYVFAATLGAGADRLIERWSSLSPSKSVVTDALASAAIEAFCNKINAELEAAEPLHPRFSPGYGDFDITHQQDILHFLDTRRKIGLYLSESLLMVPTKSVTAIIGIGPKKTCKTGCAACEKTDCAYRA